MNWKQLKFPALIAAAIFVLWMILRKQPLDTMQQVPAPASSGLPQYDPQNASYNIAPPILSPGPGLTYLPGSRLIPNLNFGGPGPLYLTYNMPKILNAVLPSLPVGLGGTPTGGMTQQKGNQGGSCGCGCQDSCSCPTGTMLFSDGNGASCIAPPPPPAVDSSAAVTSYGGAVAPLMQSAILPITAGY